MRNSSCFLLLILQLLVSSVFAQQPPYRQLTDEDGLPSNTVYSLHQDRRGFIWIGTENGIARYDGYTFKKYPAPSSMGKAMSGIKEDQQGRIWFRNFSGQLFFIENDSIQEFTHFKAAGEKHLNEYILMENGDVWMAGNNNIYRFTPRQGTYSTKLVTTFDKTIRLFSHMEEGDFVVSVSDQLSKLVNDSIIKVFDQTNQNFQQVLGVQLFYDTFFDFPRLLTYENGAFKPTNIELPGRDYNNRLLFGLYTQDGYRLIGSQNGIFVYDSNWNPSPKFHRILEKEQTSLLMEDREGNIWVSTLKNGIYVFPSLSVQLYNKEISGFEDEGIYSLTEDDDHNLLIGLSNGNVLSFQPEKGVVHTYRTGANNEISDMYFDHPHKRLFARDWLFKKNQTSPENLGFIINAKTYAPYFDDLVTSRFTRGAQAFNIKDKPFAGLPLDSAAYFLGKTTSSAIQEKDRQSYLWFSSGKDPVSQTINQVFLFSPTIRCRTALGDTIHRQIWLGFANGLQVLSEPDWERSELKTKDGKGIYAFDMALSSDGIVWVGTMDQGLFGFKQKELLYHFTTENGLKSNFCRTIFCHNGQVWVGTDKGAQLIDPDKGVLLALGREDGLPRNEITDIYIQGNDLWVASLKGLVRIPQSELKPNQTPPEIYLTGMRIWEQDTTLHTSYILPYTQNNLKIDFAAIAFRSAGNFTYAYRMLGLDSSWISVPASNNYVRYPSLPSGQYEFQVKAINEDGIESQEPATVFIQIRKPWYLRWWAISLAAVFLAGGVSLLFLLRIQVLKRENLIQKEKDRVEQELRTSQLSALKSQMNPHFIFNALNSIQEFIFQNEKLLANSYIGKFSRLMRLTLDMSNERVIRLEEELEMLRLYLELEGVRFGDSFSYHIDIDPEVNPEVVKIPSMLIQPYIENAVKHGLLHKKENRVLWVRFFASNDKKYLNVEVEDNGVGRKQAALIRERSGKKHKPFATNANEKRLELLNYGGKQQIAVKISDLTDPSQNPIGTKVEIRIFLG